jgi:hypothetical protein
MTLSTVLPNAQVFAGAGSDLLEATASAGSKGISASGDDTNGIQSNSLSAENFAFA